MDTLSPKHLQYWHVISLQCTYVFNMVKEFTVSKIPLVTLLFWMTKITATTLGETTGDLLSMILNVGYAITTLILVGIFHGFFIFRITGKEIYTHPILASYFLPALLAPLSLNRTKIHQ